MNDHQIERQLNEMEEAEQEAEAYISALIQTVGATYSGIESMADITLPNLLERCPIDKTAMAALLKKHQDAIDTMKKAQSAIETAMLQMDWKYGGEHVDGVGTVILYRKGKKEKYDNRLLVSQIGSILSDRAAQADPITAEVPPPAVATQHAVAEMAELVGATTDGFKSWRKGKAAELGIDLERYRTTEGGELAVRLEG